MEFFAGIQSVTNGLRGKGLTGVALDCSTVNEMDDIASTPGFVRAIIYVLNLCADGLLWARSKQTHINLISSM